MYFEIQGNLDSDYTLVFLNGLSQNTLSWGLLAPEFHKELRVLLVDFIFQKRSGIADKFRTYDDHAADIFQLISSEVKGKVILCGISYGSAVAQHLLVNYPDAFAGAILLSTFAHNTERFNCIGESWKNALMKGGYSLMQEVMLPIVLGRDYFEHPIIPFDVMKDSRLSTTLPSANLLNLMRANPERGDYREKLRGIKTPVMVVHGQDDLLISIETAKEVADHISNSKFVVIEKAGHTLNLEAVPQLIDIIRPFIFDLRNSYNLSK